MIRASVWKAKGHDLTKRRRVTNRHHHAGRLCLALKGFRDPILILLVIAFVAIFADVLAPTIHSRQPGAPFDAPFLAGGGSMNLTSWAPIMSGGKVWLSRLIFGARVSVVVGITAVLFAGGVGTLPRHRSRAISVAGPTGGDCALPTPGWRCRRYLSRIFLAAMSAPSELNIILMPRPGLLEERLRPRHRGGGAVR